MILISFSSLLSVRVDTCLDLGEDVNPLCSVDEQGCAERPVVLSV